MGFVSHLFYPWGFFVQIIALVHFFRRRPEWYWLLIIFMGGAIGAAVYIIAEVIPDAGLARKAFAGYGRRARISVVEATVAENPSVANLEELGELYWDEKQYARAREAFDRAIATKADAPQTFYRRGMCAFMLGDFAPAVTDLEFAVHSEPKMDFYRAAMFLSQAYAEVGRKEDAAALFAEAAQLSSTPEMLYSYAAFLKSQGRLDESREWAEKLEEKRRTSPRYVQRVERPWFRKNNALRKELNASKNN
ncbi:MAG: tetratricopeptide repeat protein [Candidatus Acidiferrales bacterium]